MTAPTMPLHDLISSLSVRACFDSRSLFRQYQDCFFETIWG